MRTHQANEGMAFDAKSIKSLLHGAKDKSQIRYEDCETVFLKKQEYLKRHTKNRKRNYKTVENKVAVSEREQCDLGQNAPGNFVEIILDDSSNADLDTPANLDSNLQDSELKACYSEEGTTGSVINKDEKGAVCHFNEYSKEDTSQKKEENNDDHTPGDKRNVPTVRKRCAKLLVLVPTK